jgi:hypothetical protein
MMLLLLVASLALRPVVVSAQLTTIQANRQVAMALTVHHPGSGLLSSPLDRSYFSMFRSIQKESPEPFALVPCYIKANVCFYPRLEFVFSSRFSSFSSLHPLVLRI